MSAIRPPELETFCPPPSETCSFSFGILLKRTSVARIRLDVLLTSAILPCAVTYKELRITRSHFLALVKDASFITREEFLEIPCEPVSRL